MVPDVDELFMPVPEVSAAPAGFLWTLSLPRAPPPRRPTRTHARTSPPARAPAQELLVNLSEGRPLVDALLNALPGMFAHTRVTESCLGPALDAAYNVMQHIGGKMVVVQVRARSARVSGDAAAPTHTHTHTRTRTHAHTPCSRACLLRAWGG